MNVHYFNFILCKAQMNNCINWILWRYINKNYHYLPVDPVCECHLFLLAHGMSGALCRVFRHAAVVFEALASTQCRLERSPEIVLLLQLCIQLQEKMKR